MTLRRACKAAVFAVALALAAPMIVMAWLEKQVSRSEVVFTLFGQALAVLPGFFGWWLRAAYCFGTLESCSWEARIGFGTLFTHRAAIIGPRVSMGAYCVVGHAAIGSDVMIGSRVSIPSGGRQHLDDRGQLTTATTRFERVSIGPHCWIGEGAILLADIGSYCIVSAGAVVTRALPGGALIGGNPAKVLRELPRCSPAERLE